MQTEPHGGDSLDERVGRVEYGAVRSTNGDDNGAIADGGNRMVVRVWAKRGEQGLYIVQVLWREAASETAAEARVPGGTGGEDDTV